MSRLAWLVSSRTTTGTLSLARTNVFTPVTSLHCTSSSSVSSSSSSSSLSRTPTRSIFGWGKRSKPTEQPKEQKAETDTSSSSSSSSSTSSSPSSSPPDFVPAAGSSTQVDVPFIDATVVREKCAKATHENCPVGRRKLDEIIRLVRRLSVREALIQLALSKKLNAAYVYRLIKNGVVNAVNDHNMNAERLYIADIQANKGITSKKVVRGARGSVRVQTRPRTHLTLVLKEQPKQEDEQRIGRRGPYLTSIASAQARVEVFQKNVAEERRKKMAEATAE